MSTATVYTSAKPVGFSDQARLYIAAFIIVLIAEYIGNVAIPLGPAKIVLLPLLWALLMGAALGLASKRMPPGVSITSELQRSAAALLQPALLLFIAKLGLLVGGSIPKLAASGGGLFLQEFGHFFGTMVFGLPIALLLGIKRQAIGATFSVGREPSLAIIAERFGMKSPEGQGVLAEYLTGTVFGAVFIALLAGLLASLNLFNPLALAMGAGVGSGSMMAAASGAIAAQQTPEVAKDVAAFAAASNLITTTIGTYFTLFLSLPFTIWAYKVLEPILGRTTKASVTADADVGADVDHETPPLDIPAQVLVWVLVGVFALFGNWINYKVPATDPMALGGMAIIIGVVLVGYLLYRLTMRKLPAVIWVSLVGMALTYPAFPFSASISAMTGKINFLALSTPILAFAGLSIAKDVPAFRRLGWRIVVVSFAANAGTFIGAAIIAQFFMHNPGV
ncbi:DUF3100 domain-containing protein [Polaromonas jejuensis]|uniref:DUF3100 domain-containing protein n=1 Tax=Polaromonas jejuensis TaxID=457502 RepID=A0ABW0QGM9_9BURK|nr:DUF3100 domain-containing protein [Polaromonas jejuensis]